MDALILAAMEYNLAKYGHADYLAALHTARAACVGVAAMLSHLGRR